MLDDRRSTILACVAGLKIGEGVVEEDLGDVLYPVSIDLLTVDTGMDEGDALRERVQAWKGHALGQRMHLRALSGRTGAGLPGGRRQSSLEVPSQMHGKDLAFQASRREVDAAVTVPQSQEGTPIWRMWVTRHTLF